MQYDPHSYRYPSRRSLVYGSRGMVAASHPLASAAGLEILKRGGNAIDAAVACAAALTVVEPTCNGLGSDAFAIVWKDGKLRGLNGSGYAPSALTAERFRASGVGAGVTRGWAAATVPAAPRVWAELTREMGRLTLAENLAPAISCAREGHAVSVTISRLWEDARLTHAALSGPEFAPWLETFCPNGRAPRPGELFTSPAHARTLEEIAATDAASFYEGDLARKILGFARRTGGLYTAEDLADFRPEWVEPVGVNYRGYDVWELPPNGQGLIVLIALSILSGFDFTERDDPATFHRQIEAIKLGFADARRCVADRRFADVPVKELLSDAYTGGRRALIAGQARDFRAGDPDSGGTVYLCAADGEGNMISYIQSNYKGFGSFVVVPETGIALNNRATCFSPDPAHPNAAAPRKRPYNTIIPGFLTKEGAPVGPFGVMGGFMQPQGHVQVVMNTADFGMNPQEALDAPRWQWTGGLTVEVEPGFPVNAAQKLSRMGHDIRPVLDSIDFGRGQIIWRTEENTLAGATEPRTDGSVAAW